jgi:hypothetical protein
MSTSVIFTCSSVIFTRISVISTRRKCYFRVNPKDFTKLIESRPFARLLKVGNLNGSGKGFDKKIFIIIFGLK